ncbi:MAG: SRPBCC family protein [Massilia sp.]
MIARLFLCLLLACALPAFGQPRALDVTVTRGDSDGGHVYSVGASGVVAAAPAKVWKILTDYERMPEFVPDMRSARVLARDSYRVTLEQTGVARFLFFRRDIHLVVQILEQPMSRIDVGLVSGDMRLYHCRWELQPLDAGGTRIVYSGQLAPKFYVPGMLGANMIRSDIEKMMTAVLDRLDRPDQAG